MGWFRKEEEKLQTLRDLPEGAYPDGPVVVTDGDFDELLRRFPLVVVDFWAEWCMPCRMITPIIRELAEAYRGKMVFAKLNVDENPSTASRYNIMSIPTLLVFRDGELVDQIVGASPRSLLEPRLSKYLG
ncbi:MAG TPA: thioredoxin [Candidatus Latescibacteria bacterium]|nr:thioredoxin [Candidatus Latescibacterota bacterium]